MSVELPQLVLPRRPEGFPDHWILPSAGDRANAERSRARGLAAVSNAVLHRPSEFIPPEDIAYGKIERVAAALVSVSLGERADGRAVAGMAAPQAGIDARVIVADLQTKYEQLQYEGFTCIVDPEIVEAEWREPEVRLEGCFSCLSANAAIEDSTYAVVRGYDLRGKPFEGEFTGFDPRILRHETDHVNGRLAPDSPNRQGPLRWIHPEHRPMSLDYHRGQDLAVLPPWPVQLPQDQWAAYKAGQLDIFSFEFPRSVL